MRVGSVALFTAVAMGVAALAAAAGGSGVGSMDSAALASGANIGGAFAGSDGRSDSDLPIATARYGEEPAPTALMAAQAGQAYASVGQAPAIDMVAPPSVTLAEVAPTAHSGGGMTLTLAGGPPGDWPIGGPPGGARGQTFSTHNPAAAPTPRADGLIDGRALLVKIGPKQEDKRRGRWFVFAAGSGKAFGLNLIRDPMSGWRQGGWSVERLAEFGKIQLGLGWRKGPAQASIAASRREMAVPGMRGSLTQEDTVFGFSFSLQSGN